MKEVIKVAYRFLGEEHSKKKERFPKEPSRENAWHVSEQPESQQGHNEMSNVEKGWKLRERRGGGEVL